MQHNFKVTPKGIVKVSKLEDSRNPNALSEELVIPREVFIDAFNKFINQLSCKRMKQYESDRGNSLMWHYEINPDLRCACGSASYRYEYDEYNDRLYEICSDCNYMGEIMPSAYRNSILEEGYWRYEDD